MSENRFKILLIFAAMVFTGIWLGKMIKSVDSVTPDNIVIVEQDKTGLYANPDSSSYQLITLDKGDKLEWISEENGWINAKQGSFSGYVPVKKVRKSARFKEDEK
ncbi:MAG: hypothetical protein GY863_05485 [bacterium]|nr:hypothetical protein [bacterium]